MGFNYKQAKIGAANDINDKPTEGTLTFAGREQRGNTSPDLERKTRRKQPDSAPTVRPLLRLTSESATLRDSCRAGREIASDAGRLRRYCPGPGKARHRGSDREAASSPQSICTR